MNVELAYRVFVLTAHLAIKLIRWLVHLPTGSNQLSRWSGRDEQDVLLAFLLTLISEASVALYVFAPGWIGWASLDFPPPVRWAGIAVGIGAVALFAWAHRSLGANFTVFLSVREEHQTVSHGPYRYIRHPVYAVFLLTGASYFLASANALLGLCWIGGGALFFRWRMPREEALLVKSLGESYRSYMKQTNRLIPGPRKRLERAKQGQVL